MKAKHLLGIIALLLAALFIWSFLRGNKFQKEKDTLKIKTEKLQAEISELEALKNELEIEVDSLSLAYSSLEEENQTLQGSLAESKSKLNRQNKTIRNLKKELAATNKNANEVGSDLRYQITNLLNAKSSLENSIRNLQAENDSLKNLTGVLTADLNKARTENSALSNLNKSMNEELQKLTLANFKASAFSVEVQKKRKNKVTSKSRAAKKINVSFDLTGVPEKYQGVRPIYLVITDEKAVPIKVKNPIQAKVSVNGQTMQLQAAEAKEVNIEANQRLSFSHQISERLKPGYYRMVVYTDIGLLGASSFRLR
ncbi:MAG TPA: hypothetical protein ENK52_05920 [Saprospiraceae bacterium]|nr:hypothetical protein [Saprospiraceae bacterium]